MKVIKTICLECGTERRFVVQENQKGTIDLSYVDRVCYECDATELKYDLDVTNPLDWIYGAEEQLENENFHSIGDVPSKLFKKLTDPKTAQEDALMIAKAIFDVMTNL